MATGRKIGGGEWESPPPTPLLVPFLPAPPSSPRCPSSYVTVRGGLSSTLLPPAAPPLKPRPVEGSCVAKSGGGRGNYEECPRERRGGGGGGGAVGSNNNNKGAEGGRGGKEKDCVAGTAAEEADEENCCCWGREAISGSPPSTPRSFFSPEPLLPPSPRLLHLPRGGGVRGPARGERTAAAAVAAGEAPSAGESGALASSGTNATPPWWTPRGPGGARGAMEEASATRTSGGGRDKRRRRMGRSERLRELTEKLRSSPPAATVGSSKTSSVGDHDGSSPKQASTSHSEDSRRSSTACKQGTEAPCPPPRRKGPHKLQTQLSGEGPSMSSLEEVADEPTAASELPTSPKHKQEKQHCDVAVGSSHHKKSASEGQRPTIIKPIPVRTTSADAKVGTDTIDSSTTTYPSSGRFLTTVPELSSSRLEEADDLVPLTLPRAESRSIVGSYARRCIPFRSASFSRVDLRPDGRCYMRSGVAPTSSGTQVKSSSLGAPYTGSELRDSLLEMGAVSEERSEETGSEQSFAHGRDELSDIPEDADSSKSVGNEESVGEVQDTQGIPDLQNAGATPGLEDKTLVESGPGPPSTGASEDNVLTDNKEVKDEGARDEAGSALYWTGRVVVPNETGSQVDVTPENVEVKATEKTSSNGIVRRNGTGTDPAFYRSQSAESSVSKDMVPGMVPLGARCTWEVRAAGRRPRKPRPLGVIRLDEESEEDEELIAGAGNRMGITILTDATTPFDLSQGGRGNQVLMSSKSLDTSHPGAPTVSSPTSKSASDLSSELPRERNKCVTEKDKGSDITDEKVDITDNQSESDAGNNKGSQVDEVDLIVTVGGEGEAFDDEGPVLNAGVETCKIGDKTGVESEVVAITGDKAKDSAGGGAEEGASEDLQDKENPSQESVPSTSDNVPIPDGSEESVPCETSEKSEERGESEVSVVVSDKTAEDTSATAVDAEKEGDVSKKLLNVEEGNGSEIEDVPSPSEAVDPGDSPSSPNAQSKGGDIFTGEVVRKRTRGKRKTRRREEEQKEGGQPAPAAVPYRKTSVYAFCDDGSNGKTELMQTRAANEQRAATPTSAEAESQTPVESDQAAGASKITSSDRTSAGSSVPGNSSSPDSREIVPERKISVEVPAGRTCAAIQVTSSSQCDPVRGSASPVSGMLGTDYSGDYTVRNASPCPTSPLDSGSISDAEKNTSIFSLDGRSPMTPRRYSKRPLRGPYGQMLEAEMKRPEAFSKLQLGDELKFLEDLAPRSGHTTAPILESRRTGRSGGGHSLDDSALRNSTSSSSSSSSTSSSSSSVNPAKIPPKRKVSAHIPYSGEHLTTASATASSSLSSQSPLVCHQRTTSSPSKLEGIASMSSPPALTSIKPRKSALSSGAKSDRGAPSPPPPAEVSSRVVSQGKKGHGSRVQPQVSEGSGSGRTDILTRLLTDQLQSGGGDGSSGKDTRSHVAVELYETERSYVESLQILVHKYLHALKSSENSGLIDSSLVDEIFFQVPEILSLHEAFLEELRGRLDHWDPVRQQLGDVFLHTFTQQGVIDTYASFINNWKHAKESIKSTCQAKPAFARFLNTMAREHKGKLAVDSLLIMPVQRIPRYELLIQMLLKHTEPSHPDYPLLVEAASIVRSLAQSINRRGRGTGTGRGSSSSSASSGTTIEAWADAILAGSGGSGSSGGSGIRTLLRVDQVTLGGKERSLILFSDLLLIASAKRRSGPSAIRKASTMSTAGGFTTGLEGHKLKLLMRIPLEDLEVVRGREEAGSVRRALKEAEKVQEDLNVVGKLSHLASSLHCSHSALDDALADLAAELRRRAAEASAMEAPLSQLPLALHTQSGSVETLLAIFQKAETRASWEEAFLEAKQKLTALSTDHFPSPEFVSPLPIRKTRAGLQFTCAAPTLPSPAPPQKEGTPPLRDSSLPGKAQLSAGDGATRGRTFSCASDISRSGRSVSVSRGLGSGWPEGGGGGEVWVCNSDGYVGQVCVLSLQPEPTVASCNGVCNARILCISAVPAKSTGPSDPYIIPPTSFNSSSSSRLRPEETEGADDGNQVRSGDDSAEGTGNIQLDSSSSESDEEEGEGGSEEGGCISQDEISSPPPPSPPNHQHGPPSSPPPSLGQASSLMGDGNDDLMMVDQSFTSGSSGASSCGTGSLGGVPGNQATMWLGTEDGCIHVYHCGDNIRTKRNKLRIQHVAAVLCILYLDDRVYVSLANGDIVVYTREQGGGWGAVESKRRAVGSSATPVTRMIAVRGRLWCGGNSQIRILNPLSLLEEHSFEVCEEGTVPSGPSPGSRWAWCLAPAAPEGAPGVGGVWVSLQHSALLRLFSPISPFPCLCSIDLTPAVGRMLASCDDIIRQHKAACLRVTALLTCQDLLWVGTSAGVILTLAMDRRQLQRAQQLPTSGGKTGSSQANQSSVGICPTVTGLPHGHTGHVRFLTCVDMPTDEASEKGSTDQKGSKSSTFSSLVASSSIIPPGTPSTSPPQSYQGSLSSQSLSGWRCIGGGTPSPRTDEKPGKILVISGGDGYEDFRNSGTGPSSEVAGREDSTNHLLLWQV